MIRAGIDWGSSSFRAYRFDETGSVIDSLESASGIKFALQRGFEQTLFGEIADWLQPGDQILLSGMITSRNGWVESPYLPAPTRLDQLRNHAVERTLRGFDLIFLPGVSQQQPPDIMRGEELQLLGADQPDDHYIAIIPGTHCKWACLAERTLQSFQTIATGELFEILLDHSLIAALASGNEWNNSAFLDAVEQGFESGTIISDLFTSRSGVILDRFDASQVVSRLSGLLIGNEIREGHLLTGTSQSDYILIGNDTLCKRYLQALQHLGYSAIIDPPGAAARGFRRLLNP